MKKITTYQILGEEEDDRRIDSVSTLSDSGKVLNLKQYEKGFLMTEMHYAYDEKDRLVEMAEQTTEGGKTTKVYTFDEEDQVVATQTFYGEELYEEQKLEYKENESIKNNWQDGKLIQKIVETEKEDGSEELLVFDEENKLIQKQLTVVYEDATEITVHDGEDKLLGVSLEFFDADDELKERKEYDGDKQLIRIDQFETQDGLITKHYIKTKIENEVIEITNYYGYDEQGNEITKRIANAEDNSLVMESRKYNEQNELVEEIYENLSGNRGYGDSYHKVYEIEEL